MCGVELLSKRVGRERGNTTHTHKHTQGRGEGGRREREGEKKKKGGVKEEVVRK